jgi:putative transposase
LKSSGKNPLRGQSTFNVRKKPQTSRLMDEVASPRTARRKSALVLEILQGKTTVVESSRKSDLMPSEIEGWIEEGKRGLETALRARPQDLREQYERELKDL